MKVMTRIVAVLVLAATTVACARVEPGHVGVRVSNWGDRGVQEEIVQPGKWVWNGPGYQMYEFPTFKQNHVYKGDHAVSFGTIEGLSVTSDIGISYRVQPDRVVKLFQDYRKGVEEITTVDMRNAVQNAFVVAASDRAIETVYGEGKAALIAEVENAVREKMDRSGIELIDVYWSGNPRLPKNVTDSINAKIQATQMAEQRENEVAQAIAEADKVREQAKGEADALLLAAQAEAEAIQIKGDALRNNPELVDLTVAEGWNGALPAQYLGSGGESNVILQMLSEKQ